MTKLSPENIKRIFDNASVIKSNEKGALSVFGGHSFRFSKESLLYHSREITEMISQLHPRFFTHNGGQFWSQILFVHEPEDGDMEAARKTWGDEVHAVMLYTMANALGIANLKDGDGMIKHSPDGTPMVTFNVVIKEPESPAAKIDGLGASTCNEGDPVWTYADGNYYITHPLDLTPRQLFEECASTLKDLLERHPEFISEWTSHPLIKP